MASAVAQRRRQLAVEHHGDAVGDLDQFVEILAGHEHGGAGSGEVEQRLADHGGGARVDAPGRLADHQHGRVAQDFAADDEFLQIAAGQARGFRIALGLAHVKGLGRAIDRLQRRGGIDEAVLDHAAGGMSGQKRVLGQLHPRRGAVAEPLLGHERRAQLAALGDRQMAGGDAFDHDRAGILRQPLAGKRRKQFVLAVAGDAGDAQDFAALQFERDVLEPTPCGSSGSRLRSLTTRRGTVVLRAAAALHFLDLGADHHARQRGGGLRFRVAGRDLLAAAQDGGGVAEPLHLFELVADVEDGAALGLQPLQHDEKLVGLLRGQHRGRLVEDQEFRILHQRADDLDALTLADRQLPDLAPGIERKPVKIGHLLEARRHVLEGFLAVEPERDVLGDGEIFEQREMLEHHADAAARALPMGRTAPSSAPSQRISPSLGWINP